MDEPDGPVTQAREVVNVAPGAPGHTDDPYHDTALSREGRALLLRRLRAAARSDAAGERRPSRREVAAASAALRRDDRDRVAGLQREVFRRAVAELRRAGSSSPTPAEVVAHVRARDRAIAALNDALAAQAGRLRQLRRTGGLAEAERLERQIERRHLPWRRSTASADEGHRTVPERRGALTRRQLETVMNRLARDGRGER